MTEAIKKMLSITKEELAQLPAAEYHADLRLVDSPEAVQEAIDTLSASDIIGFDTETRPSFKKGLSYKVSLLQLSTREVCYLFRLNKIGLTPALIGLLSDPSKLKIGLSIHDDFHNLNKLAEFTPGGFVELQDYVKDYKIADNSLARLYGIVFGRRISKAQRLTNWEADQLSHAQQVYAAMDALACIDLYECISSGNFDPDASPYMKEIEIPAPPTPEEIEERKAHKREKEKRQRKAKQQRKAEEAAARREEAAARRKRRLPRPLPSSDQWSIGNESVAVDDIMQLIQDHVVCISGMAHNIVMDRETWLQFEVSDNINSLNYNSCADSPSPAITSIPRPSETDLRGVESQETQTDVESETPVNPDPLPQSGITPDKTEVNPEEKKTATEIETVPEEPSKPEGQIKPNEQVMPNEQVKPEDEVKPEKPKRKKRTTKKPDAVQVGLFTGAPDMDGIPMTIDTMIETGAEVENSVENKVESKTESETESKTDVEAVPETAPETDALPETLTPETQEAPETVVLMSKLDSKLNKPEPEALDLQVLEELFPESFGKKPTKTVRKKRVSKKAAAEETKAETNAEEGATEKPVRKKRVSKKKAADSEMMASDAESKPTLSTDEKPAKPARKKRVSKKATENNEA